MKLSKNTFFTLVISSCLMLNSCVKTIIPPGTSALTIVNAIPNSNAVVTNFFGSNGGKSIDTLTYYNSALQIYYGRYTEVSSYSGPTNLSLSQTSDTLLPIANMTLNMQINGIYSLFLAGYDTTEVDTMFVKDNIPYYPTSGDSITGVRFVNLSKGGNPILITLQSDTTHTPILNNIVYKTITPFQSYSANTNAQSIGYNLEFRDVISDSILATSRLRIYLYKSQTLAFYGNPIVGYSVMSINNY